MDEKADKALREINDSLLAVNEKILTTYTAEFGLKNVVTLLSTAYIEQLRRGHAVSQTVSATTETFPEFLRKLAGAFEEQAKQKSA